MRALAAAAAFLVSQAAVAAEVGLVAGPLPPADTSAGARFALAGVGFGMSPDAVGKALASAYPGARVSVETAVLQDGGKTAKPYLSRMRVSDAGGSMQVTFAPPTGGGGVTAFTRTVQHDPEPFAAAMSRTMAQLTPALGKALNPVHDPGNGTAYTGWEFDAAHQVACPGGACDLAGGGVTHLAMLPALAAEHARGVRTVVWLSLASGGTDTAAARVTSVAAEDVGAEFTAFTEAKRQMER